MKYPLKKICANCEKEFEVDYKSARNNYCSHSCAAKKSNTTRTRNGVAVKKCLRCAKSTHDQRRDYCSMECKQLHAEEQWREGLLDGTGSYAPKAFVSRAIRRRSGGQCEGIDSRTSTRCTETRVVHLDHVDGNWMNNTYENVRHLCPTCHALTETYAGRNMGKGRTWKHKYNQYKGRNSS